MLVQRDVEPRAGRAQQQRLKLADVQVVGGSHALETVVVDEIVRRERVGDVERKIAAEAPADEGFQVVVVPDEVAVGRAREHLLDDPLLPRLEHPRRGDPDAGRLRIGRKAGLPRAKAGHRFAVMLRVLKFAVESFQAGTGECGGELFQAPDHYDELGGGDCGWAWGHPHSAIHAPRFIHLPPPRRGAAGLDLGRHPATQFVELTDGQDDVAFQLILQGTKLERCAAEPSELVGQAFGGQRLFFRARQR